MSAQTGSNSDTKYSTGITAAAIPAKVDDHALHRYRERTPADSVPIETAWARGEDVEHPQVVATDNPDTADPVRVRVYNHDQRYFAIFVVIEGDDGQEIVATVYRLNTHDHAPTRAYLHAHGPHYTESES